MCDLVCAPNGHRWEPEGTQVSHRVGNLLPLVTGAGFKVSPVKLELSEYLGEGD